MFSSHTGSFLFYLTMSMRYTPWIIQILSFTRDEINEKPQNDHWITNVNSMELNRDSQRKEKTKRRQFTWSNSSSLCTIFVFVLVCFIFTALKLFLWICCQHSAHLWSFVFSKFSKNKTKQKHFTLIRISHTFKTLYVIRTTYAGYTNVDDMLMHIDCPANH